jgi:hypothetical protein
MKKNTAAAQITPGPWSFAQDGYAYPSISVRAPSVSGAASHTEVARTGTEANARLIAAAPQMLSVLKAVRSQLHESDQELIDAVLANVEGR